VTPLRAASLGGQPVAQNGSYGQVAQGEAPSLAIVVVADELDDGLTYVTPRTLLA
jgi:hypothetical protein